MNSSANQSFIATATAAAAAAADLAAECVARKCQPSVLAMAARANARSSAKIQAAPSGSNGRQATGQ